MPSDFERQLAAVIESVCAQARALVAEDGLPSEEVRHLERPDGYLTSVAASELDWRRLPSKLLKTSGLWDQLSGAVDALESGQVIKAILSSHESHDPGGLWRFAAVPILKLYHADHESWEWDEDGALRSIVEWSEALESRADGNHQTMAALRFFEGPEEPISLAEGIDIRPFTDADREALWHNFGEDRLSPMVLEGWTHLIDCRWSASDGGPPFDHGLGAHLVSDVLRALRLQHPGMAETTIVWTRPYPPDDPTGPFHLAFMTAPANSRFDLEIDEDYFYGPNSPPKTRIRGGDAEALIQLLESLRDSRDDRRLALALRRFDTAYERADDEDSLLDLWIAFEALLLPDGRSELSYRASLRIALLAADDDIARKEAFRQARLSYDCRSQVVHGEAVTADLEIVVEQTRELARKALRAWVLKPPEGIAELDQLLFV
jgi:hypothetical protein